MVRIMLMEPSVFFPGKRLHWLIPTANGMHMIPMVRGVLSLFMAMAMVVFAAGNAMSDHSTQPTNTYVFTGSPIASSPDMHDFNIANDGALYFKLKSVTPAGTQANPITVGFMATTNPNTCSDRYISRITNPVVGQTYGPYYMETGTYKSYYYHLGVATTSYELDIEYHRQLTPNDTEPNDSVATAWNIGNITLNTPISGHLGYLGCNQNKHDYIRFGMLSTGNYKVNIHYDPTFSDKSGCVVWFSLLDVTAGSWPLSHTGPTDVTLGPMAFQAGRQYVVSMQSSNTCYDSIYDGGGWFVTVNKAGAYNIQIYDPNAPPPATIRLSNVQEAKHLLDKKPNQKYVIVDVENFGTSSQVGYIEISVIDNNRNVAVFSDHLDIAVSAAATNRYEFYADTRNWPTTQIKATVDLYTANKQQFLGSKYALFECVVHSGISPTLLLLLN